MSTSGADTTALRSNRDFKLIAVGQAISALGDAVSITAMPLLVISLTGSAALMGTVGALQLVPDLVLGLPVGALADRVDRRRLMFWSDVGRAVLTAFIPLADRFDLGTITVVLIVVLPINALRVVSDTAYTSSLPMLVGRENLGRANGYLEATLSVPFIIGPAIAGVLVATLGAPSTFAIDAVSFALSAACVLAVRRSLSAQRSGTRFTDDIRAGIAFMWRASRLRALVGYWGVITAATAGLLPALAFYLTVDRDRGPQLFGVLGSAWSIGYLLGSLATARLPDQRWGGRLTGGGIVMGIAVASIAGSASVVAYMAAAVVIGIGLAMQSVSYMTLRASQTPDDLLGRVGATSRMITSGLRPLGIALTGVMIGATDARATLVGVGAIVALVSAVYALTRRF